MQLTFPDCDPLTLPPGEATRVMGILNVTPDSFSDGGLYIDADAAAAAGGAMAAAGAAVIDVGGESTRPGAARVSAEEQVRRVVPVIRRLSGALREEIPDASRTQRRRGGGEGGGGGGGAVISVDTTRVAVAEAAVDAGAGLINDVSAGRDSNDDTLRLAADRGLPIVLMHMQGTPATMQHDPQYDRPGGVVAAVFDFLQERVDRAATLGLPASQIILDPGIGFGKTLEHNLALLAHLDRLVALDHPVLLGTSRKGFISDLAHRYADAEARLGEPKRLVSVEDRLPGTLATTCHAAMHGVHLVRVHDVPENVQAVRAFQAIRQARTPNPNIIQK